MEAKELKVQAPKGYEIDAENSTFECIKFKPIKKDITYEDVCNKLFERNSGYSINQYGKIDNFCLASHKFDVNNAPNREQLKRLLALNQLLNIAEYYNTLHTGNIKNNSIIYDSANHVYSVSQVSTTYLCGIKVVFNRKEDAQAVIDNPNFRDILDIIYKD